MFYKRLNTRVDLAFLMLLLVFTFNTKAQGDTINISNNYKPTLETGSDSTLNAIINDTIVQKTDTLPADSLVVKKKKWDFVTTGGNDSTYYSFYGNLLNVDDSQTVQAWKYTPNVRELEIFNYDSTLQDLQINQPAFRKVINNSYLGQSGLAVKSNIFAEPNPQTGFLFLANFTPYMYQINTVDYYNVSKPFTVFRVDIGAKDEQSIEILHTQNINPYFNVFARFKNYTGDGSYVNQATRNNAFAVGFSFTKGRLATHLTWLNNRVDAEENGGITNSYLVTDSTVSTTEVPVKLTDGSTFAKDRQFFFDQKIGFFRTNIPDTAIYGGYWFSLQYNYQQQKSKRVYEDTDDSYINPITGEEEHLYANNFNRSSTFDSASYLFRNNTFRINLEENPRTYPFIGAYFGYGIQSEEYYYFNIDTLFDNSHQNKVSSSYFEGGIYRLKGEKFKFEANYNLFISGYRQTDMQLDGFISQKFGSRENWFELKGYGGIYLETPDYLLTHYHSNHYQWKNDFVSQKRTSFNFKLTYPYYKTEIGTRFNLLSDYIYFNTQGVPEQFNETFSVFDLYLNHIYELGPFGLISRLNYQKTSNKNILPLPEFSAYAALYWNPKIYFKDTGGKLKLNLGVDVRYWTAYYGQAYSPAINQFHNQTGQLIGNYPFIGFFSNFELNRLRFYLRWEHANYGVTEPTNYFWSPDYPSTRGMFRYGIVWTFYD